MARTFSDVYDGSEISVSIGRYEEGVWNYYPIEYRRDFNNDNPDNTRNVYDKLKLKGKKLIRTEKTLSIAQEFRGYGRGLDLFTEEDGLIVKEEILPNDGSIPDVPVRYYTNWCTIPLQVDGIPDVGEFNATLEGSYDDVVTEEPLDNNF
jgi:hypothetical protein